MKPNIITFVLLFVAALARPTVAEEPKAPDPGKPPVFAGLRRSSLKEIPRTRFLFWVDFTAGKVGFRRG